MSTVDSAVWYEKGLRFKCTECGKCCTGRPGYAWVTPEEIQKIAEYLGLEVNAFVRRYLRKVEGKWSLTELKPHYDCVFLKDKRCTIYPVRPKQCQTFPWWPENLSSEEAWKETAEHCEGISDDAPIVPFGKIKAALDED